MPLDPVSPVSVLAPVGAGSNFGEAVGLADGGYMVVWTHLVAGIPIPGIADDQFTTVVGQAFNADGTPRGDLFPVNTSTNASGQGDADIVLLSNGNVAVAWSDGPDISNGADVSAWMRILGPDGTPVTDPIELSTVQEDDQHIPELQPYGDGGVLAVWRDARDPYSNTVTPWFAQIFDAAGNRVGQELDLGGTTATWQGQLLTIDDGLYAVIAETGALFELGGDTYENWNGFDTPVDHRLISGQGNAETDSVSWGDGRMAEILPSRDSIQVQLREVAEYENSDGTYPDGTPYPDTYSTFIAGQQVVAQSVNLALPDVSLDFSHSEVPATAATIDSNGNLVVVWAMITGGVQYAEEYSIYAQVISEDGVILSDPILIADQNVRGSGIFPPFVTAGDDGQVFIGWTGYTDRNGAGTNEVFGGVYELPLTDYSAQTDGDDTVHGTDGVDQFVDGPGFDHFYLFGGDDLFFQTQSSSMTTVYGMRGDDRLVATFLEADYWNSDLPMFYGGPGYDTVDLSRLPQPVSYFANVTDFGLANGGEEVIGTMFDDRLGNGNGGEGLRIHAEAGDDTINVSAYNYGGEIDGGAGFDILYTYMSRDDFVIEDHGDHYTMYTTIEFYNDTLPDGSPRYVMTLRSIDEIHFENGDDIMVLDDTPSLPSGAYTGAIPSGPPDPGERGDPTPGADNLIGTAGADEVDLLGGNDRFDALGGNDTVSGGAGADTIEGGGGADLLMGDAGNDELSGGIGNDTLDGGAGADHLIGGAGRDVASYESATRSVRVDLQNPSINYNDAAGDTFDGIEVFQTGGTIDQLRGDAAANEFYTGGLSDRLYGRAGDDLLFGETGADAFYGGLGADIMTGGDDAGRRDRYIYFAMSESGVGDGDRDVITDFVAGEDRIELGRLDADVTRGFKQGFDFVGDAGLSGVAGELAYVHQGGNTIVQADVDGDGAADFEIELTGVMDLTESDFLI